MKPGLVIILSGGQDSTTALFWAKKHFAQDELHAITMNYGQRHVLELESAKTIAKMAGCTHEIINVPDVLIGKSGLVNKDEVIDKYASVDTLPGGVEKTFVPARNALFLTLAANRAACLQFPGMVMGVCEADFGGYPDCRQEFIDRMSQALSLGIHGKPDVFAIHCPLMRMTKADSVRLAVELPGCMEALAYSHTCYNGTAVPCGQCHACLIRARGFYDAGIPDPLIVRLKKEGKLPFEYPDHGLIEKSEYKPPAKVTKPMSQVASLKPTAKSGAAG